MKSKDNEAWRPTFIGIGGMKCGTTWLSECLRYHPEVFMSAPKELHYFAAKQDKGMKWYLEHFQGSDRYRAAGEFSVSYLQRPNAAAQIRNAFGNVKILVMLRDPVQRFISHYKQLIRNGVLPKAEYGMLNMSSFRRAVEKAPSLLGHGNYYRNLERFIDLFGTDHICVVLKEDVDKNPKAELEKVYGFLEVDPAFVPPVLNKAVSPGIVPRFTWLEALRIRLFRAANENVPWLITQSRKFRLAELYRRVNSDNRPDQFKVDPDVNAELCSYYREEIQRLEQFLGRTLEVWRVNGKDERVASAVRFAQ